MPKTGSLEQPTHRSRGAQIEGPASSLFRGIGWHYRRPIHSKAPSSSCSPDLDRTARLGERHRVRRYEFFPSGVAGVRHEMESVGLWTTPFGVILNWSRLTKMLAIRASIRCDRPQAAAGHQQVAGRVSRGPAGACEEGCAPPRAEADAIDKRSQAEDAQTSDHDGDQGFFLVVA